MHLDENESELLKKWIIKRLEDISDADSDVLADYVLALVKTEDLRSATKANVTENLKDFLGTNTETFVEEVFRAISTKSYDPPRPPPKPAAPIYQAPKRQSFDLPRLPNESRKRSYSYHDWDREGETNSQMRSYHAGDRPKKQARRGGRGSDPRGGRQSFPSTQRYALSPEPPVPPMPAPPQGVPHFDPNNPLGSLFAMQQVMGMFAGMPNGASPPNSSAFRPPPAGQRCRDYDTKGFCAAGASCPYEHGEHSFVVSGLNQEYDPNDSALLSITPTRVGHVDATVSDRSRAGMRGRGRGRGSGSGNFKGGSKRSDFSLLGSTRDKTNMSIVIEQIPKEKCDEHSIRGFFEEFGNIEEVTVLPDRKVAIIRYDSHKAAKTAYESPKVVFDNRFVKIYWYKPLNMPDFAGAPAKPVKEEWGEEDEVKQDEHPIDINELMKRQEDAQRKHEEAKKQREETERQREDIDVKLKAMETERKKMADLIARKAGKASSDGEESPTQIKTEESEQTKALKAQLAKVEAEARSLGLDPDAVTNGYSSHSTYRGRGGYRGRARGRGSYRGYRGGWTGGAGFGGGAVKRLDNRPKTVAITFAEGNYDNHDEALRQFLLFNSLDSASLAKHPDREDTALITFNHRYEGEMFMDAAGKPELLHVGKVELSWHKPAERGTATNGSHEPDLKVELDETAEQPISDARVGDGYEQAEEEDLDRWS